MSECQPTFRTIKCEKPTIIYNPYLEPLLLQHKCYVIKNRRYYIDDSWYIDFCYSKLSIKYNHVQNIDDVESSYILDTDSGECFPLYYVVPCGKCVLCQQKKVQDWQCRAMCESNTSTSIPFFITLTFNNEHLPDSLSVDKKDVQNFLKRFRSYLDYNNIVHSIRYVACGEYGSQKKRPHYHLILWNVPFKTSYDALKAVEKCWDKGFCYVTPCDSGCISYVMKYVKKSRSAPDGREPVFFLASRKNAIGRQWLEENKLWIIQNMSLYFEIRDPFNNEIKRFGLPQYFIRKLYPSISTLVPKEVRDAYRRMCEIHETFKKYSDWYNVDPRVYYLQYKFSFLPCYSYFNIDGIRKLGKQVTDEFVDSLFNQMYESIHILMSYKLPSNILETLSLRDLRKSVVNAYLNTHCYTVDDLFADLSKQIRYNLHDELNEMSKVVPF